MGYQLIIWLDECQSPLLDIWLLKWVILQGRIDNRHGDWCKSIMATLFYSTFGGLDCMVGSLEIHSFVSGIAFRNVYTYAIWAAFSWHHCVIVHNKGNFQAHWKPKNKHSYSYLRFFSCCLLCIRSLIICTCCSAWFIVKKENSKFLLKHNLDLMKYKKWKTLVNQHPGTGICLILAPGKYLWYMEDCVELLTVRCHRE